MKKNNVTPDTLDQFGSGTLIQAFAKLNAVDASNVENAVVAINFQTKIGQELERRGYTYDEDEQDWFYYL